MSVLHRVSGCHDDGRAADLVFLHGLGGDAFGTWSNSGGVENSWLGWLGEDFPRVGVWSAGYASSPTKWARIGGWFSEDRRDAGYGMALPTRAGQMLDSMIQQGLGQKPLLLVCHSLGGLVAKQILRMSSDALEPEGKSIFSATRAVLFLATPHSGSDLATRANAFRLLFGTTVTLEGLRAHDAHLGDLYNWYRNHAQKAGIRTATYFEARPFKGVTIVKSGFAHPGVGEDPVALDEDHCSIAKPRDRNGQVVKAAGELIRKYLLAPERREVAAGAAAPGRRATTRSDKSVPLELPPAAEEYFGRQKEIEQVVERLRAGKNTAVVGPAGMGKTALAAQAVRQLAGDKESMPADGPFPDGIVFLDLYRYQGVLEPAWNALANKISGADFLERSAARERAANACHGRWLLVVVEGGEEASGENGRPSIHDLLEVLSPRNRWLLLTRLKTQAAASESVSLQESLSTAESADLLNSLTNGSLSTTLCKRVLDLLEGHPLALTWAGNLLIRDDEDPEVLVDDWERDGLPALNDPQRAERTLEWLFGRSVRTLHETERRILSAAAVLAHGPFPLAAINAALPETNDKGLREALQRLVQSSLLRRSEEAESWRFSHVLGYQFSRSAIAPEADLRLRLGEWLRSHLTELLWAQKQDGNADRATRALEHFASLLATDKDQELWAPLVLKGLYDFSARTSELGRLAQTQLILAAVGKWMAQLPETADVNFYWRRERSVLLDAQGTVRQEQGDLPGALAAFEEALKVSQRLAQADPSNAGWQRDVSVSQNNIGNVLREQGDFGGALAAFEEALQARQRLAQADPSNAGWQRDVSVSQSNIGNVLREQGDLGGALAAFEESLQVSQRLAQADPSNAGWQRDVSVSQNNIGIVLREQGDLGGALAAFKESLQARQRLAQADPSNARWRRDVSVSQSNIGEVLREQGDLPGALAVFEESLQVSQRLAQADPSNAGWQRDVSVSQNNVGEVLREQGDLGGALAAFKESLQARQRLAQADPSNAGWRRDVSVSQDNVCEVLREQGDLGGALAAFEESLQVSQRLAQADPSNAGWQRDVSVSQNNVGEVLREQGDLGGGAGGV